MARKHKQQTVILVTSSGLKQELGIQHAERLLDMGSFLNGGWKLPEDSSYYYDEENGLRLKSGKADTAKAD